MLRILSTTYLLRNGRSNKNWNLILNAYRTIVNKGGKSCIPPSTSQSDCRPPCPSHPPKAIPPCSPAPKCPKHPVVPKKCVIPPLCPSRCPQPFTFEGLPTYGASLSLGNKSNKCSRRICPPPCSLPGPIPYNPCCPQPHKGDYKKYRQIFLLMVPVIFLLSLYALGNELPHKKTCREFVFMRRRTKRFPWGDGNKSLFHNDHTNSLPEECEPPPLICEPADAEDKAC